MVMLVVDLLNPTVPLANDPAKNVDTIWSSETEECASGDINIVADGPKSYWSPEEASLAHYQRHFSAPELDTQQSSKEDTNPLVFRTFKCCAQPRSPAESELNARIAIILDQPLWWEEVWGKTSSKEQLLTSFLSRYVTARLGRVAFRYMEIISSKVHKSAACERAITKEAYCNGVHAVARSKAWFDSLCGDNKEPQKRVYTLHPHRYRSSVVREPEDSRLVGKSISFMSTYDDFSVEELRFHHLQRAQDGESSPPQHLNPYMALIWLIFHTTVLVKGLESPTYEPKDGHTSRNGATFSHPWKSIHDHVVVSCLSSSLMGIVLSGGSQRSSDEDSSAIVLMSSDFPIQLVPRGVRKELVAQISAIQRYLVSFHDQVSLIVDRKLAISADGRRYTDGSVQETAVRDGWIASDLHETLMNQCDRLSTRDENSTEHCVRPLIDPSLFLSVRGLTRCFSPFSIQRVQSTKAMLEQFDRPIGLKPSESAQFTNASHQWIPSDVRINNDASVEFLSYINNLHPHHDQPLYRSIGRVFESMVPLFDCVLSQLTGSWPQPVFPRENTIVEPERRSAREFTLRGRVVQLIVSLYESRLKDNDSVYCGEEWHHDGHSDMHILATGFVVLHSDNLVLPELAFARPTMATNTKGGSPAGAFEEMGSISCHPGRCIVFPQYYKHKLSALRRVNPENNGQLRVLAIHVLDPTHPALSTADIPPQRQSWIFDATVALVAEAFSLPMEVQKLLETMLSDVGWSLILARKLLEKRKTKTVGIDPTHENADSILHSMRDITYIRYTPTVFALLLILFILLS